MMETLTLTKMVERAAGNAATLRHTIKRNEEATAKAIKSAKFYDPYTEDSNVIINERLAEKYKKSLDNLESDIDAFYAVIKIAYKHADEKKWDISDKYAIAAKIKRWFSLNSNWFMPRPKRGYSLEYLKRTTQLETRAEYWFYGVIASYKTYASREAENEIKRQRAAKTAAIREVKKMNKILNAVTTTTADNDCKYMGFVL